MSPHLREGDQVPFDLTPYWSEGIDSHSMIYAGRPQHRCVRWLMEHIAQMGYSKNLVPYVSIVALLISIPDQGLVNYDRTFKVCFDDNEQHVVMKFWFAGSLKWETTCQASETIDTFEHFLNEHPDWSDAARRTHLTWLRFNEPLANVKPTRTGVADLFWKEIGSALTLIIPQANPDFDRLIDRVAYWMIEYDRIQDETVRELGFDQHDNVILAMPLDRNYGYWTDNHLKLSDYDRFNPIPITEKEFDTAWLKFTSEWKRR
jgi:hypothetical protein